MLGCKPGFDGVSAYAAPAWAETLNGLSPTYIGVGNPDIFIEENLDFEGGLIRSGVPCALRVYDDAFHGFDLALTAAVSRMARRDRLDALRRGLGQDGDAAQSGHAPS